MSKKRKSTGQAGAQQPSLQAAVPKQPTADAALQSGVNNGVRALDS